MSQTVSGHYRRYAVNCAKAERELNWSLTVTFEQRWQKPLNGTARTRSGSIASAQELIENHQNNYITT